MEAKAFEDVMASLLSLSDEQAINVLAGCATAMSDVASNVTIQVNDEIRLVIQREAFNLRSLTSLGGDTDPMFKAADRVREALRGLPRVKAIQLLLQGAAAMTVEDGPIDESHLRQDKVIAYLSDWVQTFSEPEYRQALRAMREEEQKMN
jgi:hypothetical protein